MHDPNQFIKIEAFVELNMPFFDYLSLFFCFRKKNSTPKI